MADRFYFDGDWGHATAKGVVNLTGSEAHHLSKVLRKKVDDLVELFDGRGQRAEAKLIRVGKRDADLELLNAPQPCVKKLPRVTLAVAPPKGDRFRWLIEKATEIGVAQFIPLRTEHSVVLPGGTKLEKLHQTMIAACKQSGRDEFMEIAAPIDLQQLPESLSGNDQLLYGDVPREDVVTSLSFKSCNENGVVVVIGPEGGLTEAEIDQLREWGGQPLSVSPHVLRIETAAIAVASLLVSNFSLRSD
ncbi:RsmE family RNA methyltransferase [Thalassoglobus sp.]|uniref:RsmE family RNA methyltransferase n=1 Tax=Thalassoglobus sp. TaxID=2795869 RepID=UPI003AA9BD39